MATLLLLATGFSTPKLPHIGDDPFPHLVRHTSEEGEMICGTFDVNDEGTAALPGADWRCKRAPSGQTPLMLACINGEHEEAEKELRANPHARDSQDEQGNTALMLAARADSHASVRMLLHAGANASPARRARGGGR